MRDYYDIDDDEAETVAEHLTATELTDEAREYAKGLFGLRVELDGEWSDKRSAQAVYDYLTVTGEPVTMNRTTVSFGVRVGSPMSRSQPSTSTPRPTRTEHTYER